MISSIDKRLGSAVRKLFCVLKNAYDEIKRKWTMCPGAHAVSDTGWLLEVLLRRDKVGKYQSVITLD